MGSGVGRHGHPVVSPLLKLMFSFGPPFGRRHLLPKAHEARNILRALLERPTHLRTLKPGTVRLRRRPVVTLIGEMLAGLRKLDPILKSLVKVTSPPTRARLLARAMVECMQLTSRLPTRATQLSYEPTTLLTVTGAAARLCMTCRNLRPLLVGAELLT